MLKALDKVLLC